MRIEAGQDKSGDARLLPLAPEFAEMLLAIPKAQRTGTVFPLVALNGERTTGRVVGSRQEALDQLPSTRSLTRHVWIERGADIVSSWPEAEVPGAPLAFEVTPNTVSIRYQANTAGILTLTDGYGEGWRASVNGRETTVLRVDGTFRGVQIEAPGTHEVLFWYRPPYWTLSLGLALAGAGWLCAAQWFAVRSRSA